MKKMTQLDAEKIVARLSAMTQKDMVKAMTEGEEFQCLHDELLVNGWAGNRIWFWTASSKLRPYSG